MKNLARIILALAVIGLGVWLWRTFFPSPEKVIAARLQRLAHAASARPGEGYLPRMAGAQVVGGICASNVELNIDVPGFHHRSSITRDDIVQLLMGASLAGGLTVDFSDINVAVGADKESAEADLTVQAHIPGEKDNFIEQMRVSLRKIDGQWVITNAQTVRPFSDAGGWRRQTDRSWQPSENSQTLMVSIRP